ncbi:MAG TPA: GC-type dockerin domain-anchored protein [Phycisphaerales bacterium]|nr:GC-type dockerin domain-anchored protein [Phycisphaerales bacterium]
MLLLTLSALCTLAAAPALADGFGDLPVIVQQPTDRTLCAGSQASLTVRAAAPGPMTFMWQIETAPGEWSQLPIFEPADGLWARVSVGVDEQTGACTLFFAWIGTLDTRAYRCLVSGPFGGTVTDPARLTALSADFGGTGGVREPDFVHDNNDLVVFIDTFFAGESAADLGSVGGARGGDGTLDNNDFVVFIDLFFNHCMQPH